MTLDEQELAALWAFLPGRTRALEDGRCREGRAQRRLLKMGLLYETDRGKGYIYAQLSSTGEQVWREGDGR